jgi:fatty-acyl-CoA synthase
MPFANENTLTFVSNGPALVGMAVRIVDDQGGDIGELIEGRVQISGESVTTGYLNEVDAHQFTKDGWFDTGDLGFMVDGELYISGRAKDLIIRAGVNVSPQHIEWAIEQTLQLRPAQVAAFSVIDPSSAKETVVVIIGKRYEASMAQDLKLQLTRVVVEKVGIQVDRIVFSGGIKIPKTTSGKVQRSLTRQMYLNNEFSEIASQTL